MRTGSHLVREPSRHQALLEIAPHQRLDATDSTPKGAQSPTYIKRRERQDKHMRLWCLPTPHLIWLQVRLWIPIAMFSDAHWESSDLSTATSSCLAQIARRRWLDATNLMLEGAQSRTSNDKRFQLNANGSMLKGNYAWYQATPSQESKSTTSLFTRGTSSNSCSSNITSPWLNTRRSGAFARSYQYHSTTLLVPILILVSLRGTTKTWNYFDKQSIFFSRCYLERSNQLFPQAFWFHLEFSRVQCWSLLFIFLFLLGRIHT